MRDILRMVLTLVAISGISAVGLAWVEDLTKERILEEVRLDTREAIENVSPPFDNFPVNEAFKVKPLTYFPLRLEGKLVGFAVRVRTKAGYSGEIVALAGITLSGTVTGVEILSHAETPGLGAKFTEPEFLDQFPGKSLDNSSWLVTKDGGDFDQITGATITPRALLAAIEAGLRTYRGDRQRVLAAADKAAKQGGKVKAKPRAAGKPAPVPPGEARP